MMGFMLGGAGSTESAGAGGTGAAGTGMSGSQMAQIAQLLQGLGQQNSPQQDNTGQPRQDMLGQLIHGYVQNFDYSKSKLPKDVVTPSLSVLQNPFSAYNNNTGYFNNNVLRGPMFSPLGFGQR